MLPFLSKIHQNRWPVGPLGPTSILGPSAPSPPLCHITGCMGLESGVLTLPTFENLTWIHPVMCFEVLIHYYYLDPTIFSTPAAPLHMVTHHHMRWHTITCGDTPSHVVTHHHMRWHTITCGDTPSHVVTHHHMRWHTITWGDTPSHHMWWHTITWGDTPSHVVTHHHMWWHTIACVILFYNSYLSMAFHMWIQASGYICLWWTGLCSWANWGFRAVCPIPCKKNVKKIDVNQVSSKNYLHIYAISSRSIHLSWDGCRSRILVGGAKPWFWGWYKCPLVCFVALGSAHEHQVIINC